MGNKSSTKKSKDAQKDVPSTNEQTDVRPFKESKSRNSSKFIEKVKRFKGGQSRNLSVQERSGSNASLDIGDVGRRVVNSEPSIPVLAFNGEKESAVRPPENAIPVLNLDAINQDTKNIPKRSRLKLSPGDLRKDRLTSRPGTSNVDERSDYRAEKQKKRDKLAREGKRASEILPYLFVSGEIVAKDRDLLKEKKITHVLNTAHSVCKNYHPNDFEYLHFNLLDSATESIYCFLLKAIDFIESARLAGGACFVHCHMGVSRSCTCVIAYLMWKEKMTYQDAFDFVRERRSVCSPNNGFTFQLMAWEKRLMNPLNVPELYRIAPHSKSDEDLVAKLCTTTTGDAIKPTVRELDSRGAFWLFIPEEKQGFIWIGDNCESPKLMKQSTKDAVRLMRKYEPNYKDCAIIVVGEGKQQQASKFWNLLGGSPENVPKRLEAYDTDYTSLARTPAVNPHRSSKCHPGHSQRHLTTASKDKSTNKENLGESDEETLFVKLFQCADAVHFVRFKEYVERDLENTSFFVLLVHDTKKSPTDASHKFVHRAYLWLGSQVEAVVNRNAAIERANEFVSEQVLEVNHDQQLPKIIQVEDGSEPAEFWDAFEAGY